MEVHASSRQASYELLARGSSWPGGPLAARADELLTSHVVAASHEPPGWEHVWQRMGSWETETRALVCD
jgi:hypothetical protein